MSIVRSRVAVGAVLTAFVVSLMLSAQTAAGEPGDGRDGNDNCEVEHQAQGTEELNSSDTCVTAALTIVSSLPLALGPAGQSSISHSIVNAIQMALADAGNRVGHIQINYRSLDDGTPANGWPGEVANANQAAADPSVVAYIGPFNSGAAKKSIPILCTAGLGMVSPTNTYPGLTKAFPINLPGEPGIFYLNGCARNYSRVLPQDTIEGELSAIRVLGLGATSAYVVQTTPNNPWAYGFLTRAAQIGLLVAADETIGGQEPSYTNLGQRVAASGANFLFLSCFSGLDNCPRIVRDIRATAPNVRIMINDITGDPVFLSQTGAAAEGILIVREFVSPLDYTGAAAAWHARYEARYGPETTDGFNATLYAYDATRAVLAAIRRAGPHPDRNSVRVALMSTTNFPGLLGRWSFDSAGDTTLSMLSTAEVRGGVWVTTGIMILP